MQTIAATAGLWIIEGPFQLVLTEEPIKGGPRSLGPLHISSDVARFQASPNHRAGLHGLLIEDRLRTASYVESVGSDRREISFSRTLLGYEEGQRAKPGRDHFVVIHPCSRYKQCLG